MDSLSSLNENEIEKYIMNGELPSKRQSPTVMECDYSSALVHMGKLSKQLSMIHEQAKTTGFTDHTLIGAKELWQHANNLNLPYIHCPSFLESDLFALHSNMKAKYHDILRMKKEKSDYITKMKKEEESKQYEDLVGGAAPQRTTRKVRVAGRDRCLYLGKHNKQYVKMGGRFVAVASLKHK